MLGGAKHILDCSPWTCNEAVREDMQLAKVLGIRPS